jgi:tryptophanyl-tRNA synthetase
MSKVITDEEIQKAVMKIPTDSKGIDEPKNTETDTVFTLHKLFTTGTLTLLKK